MPRANRYYLPGLIWHITHRCHKKEFLLKFVRDRKRWLYWLFQAKKRYGLRILNYALTSNHIHLLVADGIRPHVIAKSMKLIEGRTAQEFNKRKNRSGAFWEDRYHSTAIESGSHLLNCMIYIDLNMVRAGRVGHPKEWLFCGYNEIQDQRQRYKLIDYNELTLLLGMNSREELRDYYRKWIDHVVMNEEQKRESKWTESLAVGSKKFVEMVDKQLKPKAQKRRIKEGSGGFELREELPSYEADFGYKIEALSKSSSL